MNTPAAATSRRDARSPDFTICVLLYGDYPDLAVRCLSKLSFLWRTGAVSLRIGTNAISERTQGVLRRLDLEGSVYCRSKDNIKKYPMMKRLFGSHQTAIEDVGIKTPLVMWFDDDSYISADDPHQWLALVKHTMETADVIGSVYSIRLKGKPSWIMRQPWYAGLPVRDLQRVEYCTGGWWTARSDVLIRFHWPAPDLLHRGGDVMLGELCRQQRLRLVHFREGVAINADLFGAESKSPRRGFDSLPIGFE